MSLPSQLSLLQHVHPNDSLIKLVEVAALLVGAFSGFAEARRKGMDIVGVFTVAFIGAFGGGTMRDILLDRRPLFWVEHQEYALLIFVLALVASPFMRLMQKLLSEQVLIVTDAFGLGLFSVAGVATALDADMPVFVAAMMGVITGTFGGVLRDVVCNEVPMVFRDGKPYAICAFFGCLLYLLMHKLDVGANISLWLSALAIVAMRLYTWHRKVTLKSSDS